jgi:hypothetical protein
LHASGLIRIGNPCRYGGYPDIVVDAVYDVGWELAWACGSTAWCYSLWTVHNCWAGHLPEKAQDEFFATGPDSSLEWPQPTTRGGKGRADRRRLPAPSRSS